MWRSAGELTTLCGRRELLCGVLTDRLEQREAPAAEPQEALVDERRELVQVGVAHGLGSLQRTTTCERGQTREQLALASRQQLVAPRNRLAQRLLATRRVARARCQQRQPLLQALEDRVCREHARAPRSQFDRQRQPVQPLADRLDNPLAEAERELFSTSFASAQREQRGGVVQRQGVDRVHPLARQLQPLTACHEQIEQRTLLDETCDVISRGNDVLEVVEHQQGGLARQPRDQISARADRLRDRIDQPCRIRERRERDPPDTAAIPLHRRGCDPECQLRLADAPRPQQRHHMYAGLADERSDGGELAVTPDADASTPQAAGARTAIAAEETLRGPRWYSRSGAARSLSRCSPRSTQSPATSARVAADTSTCPPCPAAEMRAARCTSIPM